MEGRRFKPIPNLRCRPGDLLKSELLASLPRRIELLSGSKVSVADLNLLTRGQLKAIHYSLLRRRFSIPQFFEEIRMAKARKAGELTVSRKPNPHLAMIRSQRAEATRALAIDADGAPF